MSNSTTTRQSAYQFLLRPDEVPVAATAMRLFISDEAHQARVHQLGREVLGALQGVPEKSGTLTMVARSRADEDHVQRGEAADG